MKQVINVGIGGKSFVMDNDAYMKLGNYLERFKSKIKMGNIQTSDVMDDLEERIAELFSDNIGKFKDVVDLKLVNMVISQLGMPDGEPFVDNDNGINEPFYAGEPKSVRKFYRNPINKSIGGVCSGLAVYFDLDTALIRVLFVVCFFMGLASFWAYIILWIVAPLASTPVQKCEMYGLPVTAENLSRFSCQK